MVSTSMTEISKDDLYSAYNKKTIAIEYSDGTVVWGYNLFPLEPAFEAWKDLKVFTSPIIFCADESVSKLHTGEPISLSLGFQVSMPSLKLAIVSIAKPTIHQGFDVSVLMEDPETLRHKFEVPQYPHTKSLLEYLGTIGFDNTQLAEVTRVAGDKIKEVMQKLETELMKIEIDSPMLFNTRRNIGLPTPKYNNLSKAIDKLNSILGVLNYYSAHLRKVTEQ